MVIADDVQDLLESLAVAVGRGMSVDDLEGRVVAHSAHHGEVDPVRAHAILSRSVPAEVEAWQEAHGVTKTCEPVRIPDNPELGMASRLCVPLLHQDRRVGYLWIIEGTGPLSAEEQSRAIHDAAAIAALLDDGGSSHTLRRLLTGEIAVRRAAGVLGEGPLRVLALRRDPANLREAVGVELARLRRPPAFTILDRHAVLLLNQREDAQALGERLAAGTRGKVGISAIHPELESAVEAYREAVAAARAAAAEPGLGPVARWPELGVYRLIAEPTATPIAGLREHPALMLTLESYLDSGGDAQETARLLHLHRTSLYYRLARIEELTGRSLKNGTHRLELHLALKLIRWNTV
ncbi:DNA-binding transcriptional regulator, PucR family [Streptosporangium subroseum]|uniref:DNA-binding transcriptional regulator, PucR family n=1 Tax=Streptosporangium subroseum TaxID=106412 RepID=A0A239B3A8_9ACTN|nr:helix-turn-helix domain-containing protein [Streptosporangium subroseum]SNS02290.1 DNA-binding transcriptional regulator, PucR family [Streptosporangium subroseum]